jgi:hypothetical protein
MGNEERVTELLHDAHICMLTTMTDDGRHVSGRRAAWIATSSAKPMMTE